MKAAHWGRLHYYDVRRKSSMSNESRRERPLVSLARAPRRMPPNWTPSDPAWATSFPEQTKPVVMAYFGTQLEPDDAEPRAHRICEFFEGDYAPSNVESASFVDRRGRRNLLSVAYWTDPDRFERWNARFERWWKDPARQRDREGHFREILTVPKDRFETILSFDYVVGVAKLGGPAVGPIREHSYWGSMRDRLAVSADDDLSSSYGEGLPRLGAAITTGRRLRVTVPANLAVIRSGQDWTNCAGSESAFYSESVHPTLIEAMQFLRDHPNETGCCDLRFATQIDRDGTFLKKTFGLGYFLTLGDLEKWAANNALHLAIYSRFGKMIREFGSGLKLRLWHGIGPRHCGLTI
jgi:aldoxime dehydratase